MRRRRSESHAISHRSARSPPSDLQGGQFRYISVRNVGLDMQKPEIAFLVYRPLKQRRSDNSFDGNDNIGAEVIADTLRRSGIGVGYCDPATAHEWPLVLVSFTSIYDLISFYQQVALRSEWQPGRRAFKVLGGGFGLQNPIPVRHFIDYAAFGRAEDWVAGVVQSILGGSVPQHESLMHLPDIHTVRISQASRLYPYTVNGWSETFVGCPLKCKFCHYTFARKHQGGDDAYGGYVQGGLTGGRSVEVTWDQVVHWQGKVGRIRSALDGWSERLRYIYGKRISDDDITAGVENIGSYDGTSMLFIYNIGNFPGETEEDRGKIDEAIRRAQPKHRVVIVLTTTAFRAAALTPMQWEPVSLYPDYRKTWSGRVISDTPTLRGIHSIKMEVAWSHLLHMLTERARPEDDALFHAVCFAPKLQSGRSEEKLALLTAHFDVSHLLRKYDFDEKHPAWFLESYLSRDVLIKIARKMREQIDYSATARDWLPGGKGSIVSAIA